MSVLATASLFDLSHTIQDFMSEICYVKKAISDSLHPL